MLNDIIRNRNEYTRLNENQEKHRKHSGLENSKAPGKRVKVQQLNMSLRLRSALMPLTDDVTWRVETIKPTANKNELSSTNYHRLFESIAAKEIKEMKKYVKRDKAPGPDKLDVKTALNIPDIILASIFCKWTAKGTLEIEGQCHSMFFQTQVTWPRWKINDL